MEDTGFSSPPRKRIKLENHPPITNDITMSSTPNNITDARPLRRENSDFDFGDTSSLAKYEATQRAKARKNEHTNKERERGMLCYVDEGTLGFTGTLKTRYVYSSSYLWS